MSPNILLILLMLIVGGLAATQSALNAQLSKFINSPMQAAFISFLVGTVVLSAMLLFAREGLPSVSRVVRVPPVYFLGGLLGVIFITTIIFLIPRIGVANVLLAGITGQLLVSVVIDHYGWFGVRAHPVDGWRLLGLVLMVAGVLVLNRRMPL